ncbi:MAG: TlpA disulfide reductase family protein [Sulfurimicrobium sp.]|nr:TlpA disulfide reductase family protein [Sulfurimicrobium sp.]MDP1705933.1 TlpA disulfide reductase family protein [Sulfurimicrobium sp.]MDP2197878.1 TlpA disulfide reductase family protein [Sulfurimicrobium sp.]MDZ7655536.1 TlpA disulfide reductase family protein [Sulfurimicrobium sp.]
MNLKVKLFLLRILLASLGILGVDAARAAALNDANAVPHLNSAGRQGYQDFLQVGKHRAFAIAPGGTWSWKGGEVTADMASDGALQACQESTSQTCVLYALNDRVVFNAKDWSALWRPYRSRAEAAKADTGKARGERFFDLAIKSPAGKAMKLSDLRGKVLLVHFWGTWCPPCRNEMPELQKLHQALGGSSDIQLVLLQMREDYGTASLWMDAQGFKLPLFDSGVADAGSDTLTLANGKKMRDRDLARVFPTTYVLDKHGMVVFSHVGPVSGWLQYLPFLRDVAARSGK